MVPIVRARSTSDHTRIGRLRRRSTQAPACRANSRNARLLAAESAATSKVLALRLIVASSGRASSVTCDPTSLTVWPAQSRVKSRARHREVSSRSTPYAGGVIHFLDGLLILASLGMIVLVLLHKGKGGGLSTMFGGGVSSSLGGSAVVEKNLDRFTIVCGLVWFTCIIALGLLLKTS